MIPIKTLQCYIDRCRWSNGHTESLHGNSVSLTIGKPFKPNGYPIMIAFERPVFEEVIFSKELPSAEELHGIILNAVNIIVLRHIHGS